MPDSFDIHDLVANNPRLGILLDRFEPAGPSTSGTSGNGFLREVMRAYEDPQQFSPSRLRSYPLPVILDYLYHTHRYYLEQRLPEIEQSAEALIEHCGDQYPMLALLPPFLVHYRHHLEAHITEEEAELFPYLTYLYFRDEYGEAFALKACDDPTPVALADHAHDEEDHALSTGLKLWRSTVVEQYPDLVDTWPCKVLFNQIDAFSDDIRLHERIEDEVLIPLARSLRG